MPTINGLFLNTFSYAIRLREPTQELLLFLLDNGVWVVNGEDTNYADLVTNDKWDIYQVVLDDLNSGAIPVPNPVPEVVGDGNSTIPYYPGE